MIISKCGTNSGYLSHRSNNETACLECKKAHANYQIERKRKEGVKAIKIAKCGTHAGFMRHRNQKETICLKCKNARNCYRAETRRTKGIPKRIIAQCGTKAGHNKHLRNKENSCDLCRIASVEYGRKYGQKNLEKGRLASRKRRSSKQNNGYEFYLEGQVLEKYGTDCHICDESIDLTAPRQVGKLGWERGLHIDHVIPISKGGADTIEQVRPSHASCNLTKGNKLLACIKELLPIYLMRGGK